MFFSILNILEKMENKKTRSAKQLRTNRPQARDHKERESVALARCVVTSVRMDYDLLHK